MPLTSTYSVNWPHAAEACFATRPRGGPRPSRPRSPGGGGGAPPSMLREAGTFRGAVGGDGGDGGEDDDAAVHLAPEFEAHVRDLSNWTLGPSFADAFPQWKDCVRIKT